MISSELVTNPLLRLAKTSKAQPNNYRRAKRPNDAG
jgi:hypothetical protein